MTREDTLKEAMAAVRNYRVTERFHSRQFVNGYNAAVAHCVEALDALRAAPRVPETAPTPNPNCVATCKNCGHCNCAHRDYDPIGCLGFEAEPRAAGTPQEPYRYNKACRCGGCRAYGSGEHVNPTSAPPAAGTPPPRPRPTVKDWNRAHTLAVEIIDAIPSALGMTPDPWPTHPDPQDGEPHRTVANLLLREAATSLAPVEARWQSMETAPKDGTRILVVNGGVHIAKWDDEAEFERFAKRPGWQVFACEDGFYSWSFDPEEVTAWMPLPVALPAATEK